MEQNQPQAEQGELDERRQEVARIEKLNALALSMTAKRKAVINARRSSGIEQIWLEDEDAFDGVDDANRAQEGAVGTRNRYLKPSSLGGVVRSDNEEDPNKCILLPNITGPYCEAGAASIADILLPLDDWPFGIGPTPVPELVNALQRIKGFQPDQPVQMPGMPQPAAADQVKQQIEAELEKAKKCAEKAETRIKDWLTECQWHGKSRRQIDDSARVGTGITKGPVPSVKKQYAWVNQDGTQQMVIREETKPVTESVDYWNLYPDYPACGENIHNGSFVWERGEITCKTLQDLRGQSQYIDSQIELCLSEGPKQFEVEATERKQATTDETLFEIWWFHGDLKRDDIETVGCDCSDMEDKYLSVPAVITVVNGRIIKASLNHLDKGSFPYDVLTWRRRHGMPWGQGIARQIRPAQRGITACFRALMENAGLSAKPMLAVLRQYLEPVDHNWTMFGGKVFEVALDADVRDIKASITSIQIESRQVELLNIIQFLLKLAEDITGQPLLLQGQSPNAPDTLGATQIVNSNASVTRRRLARQFDDQKIEPEITRYYDYLMQYGEDEEEKGLYVIDARSSSVLVERDIQNKGMIQLLGASANPAYGADPRKAYAEAAKAMKIDPRRIQYEDEQWKKIQENSAKQPPAPQVAVAQIREQGAMQRTQMEIEAEAAQNEKDRQVELILAQAEREIDAALMSKDKDIALTQAKTKLADTLMKLRTQERLSPGKQVVTAPSEPAGLASRGNAFQE
mgnify:CR=1 FL=1